ncbi:DUF2779 domain-containing protein [Helicobacter cynogastricus]|uniref:DUF2779 domain-containing protein n=1 Tax=Helicobacter cynogastricus TaxID=329937 RepID=UPI000CF063F6|nr:DUF2779 domain-containing protein [Helicobacter cynogastricus]
MNLSKSQFVRGMQCPKMLWLEKHKKEVFGSSNQEMQRKLRVGQEVGLLAQGLFAGGVEVEFNDTDMAQMATRTQELIKEGQSVIYEATFSYQNLLVRVDILEIMRGNGGKIEGLILHEVKSSTNAFEDSAKTTPKDAYLWDLAIQYYALSGLGYTIKGANLIHLNNNYTKQGALDLESLFLKNDLLKTVVDFQPKIPEYLETMRKAVKSDVEPEIEIGMHCEHPYACDAKGYCWESQRGLGGTDHVFNISKMRFDQKMKLYDKKRVFFKDLDEQDLCALSRDQRRQVECALQNKTYVDQEAIRKFLDNLRYPIYHLDFETEQRAIPHLEGTKPYAQIPFQYSIHIDFDNGKLEHREFLADCGTDGRLALAQKLVEDIPSDACVLAYNATFEKGVLENLAKFLEESHPDLSVALLKIKANIFDLMQPFSKGHYYAPQMGGSHSIKSVLPALVPAFEHAYKNLELVHNGTEAMEVYERMPQMPKKEQEKYKKALLEYCKLDTLAMVEVLKVLKIAVK